MIHIDICIEKRKAKPTYKNKQNLTINQLSNNSPKSSDYSDKMNCDLLLKPCATAFS